ncbi:thymidylate synthase [Virgibacillus pantothenticus]|uniref:thymidylate synthase n=1 Tax=Virgibacillus pantothenticus TaxID=1473 RepID=UPI0009842735|nr:thymidylate synthase [Virgibacillus pantothenticus]
MRFNNFHEAYIETLGDVYHKPQFYNAPRGNKSREKLNYHLTIQNPIERVCYLPSRKTNIVFNFAEVLWYLSGDNSLDFIGYYNKKMHEYSMNGKTLTGTAYGPKIFEFGNAKINQWTQMKELLTNKDPDSKRAFIQIFDATELVIENNMDISCTLGLQFFVREGKLYMASYMRANDAFRGMVSDIFSFTFIQELMARELDLEIGEFFHNVGSIHIYQPDDNWTDKVLHEANSVSKHKKAMYEFPKMPSVNNWSSIESVLKYEALLRKDQISMASSEIEQLDLPEYWKQVLLLFSLYQYIAYKRPIDFSLYHHLWPVYQHLVDNKWPLLRQSK